MKMYELFLTCPKGLEQICKKEIASLCTSKIKTRQGGMSFEGTILDIYKINLCSRLGMNLLVKIMSFNFKTIKDFYTSIYQYKWHTFIDPKMTFSIDVNIIKENSLFNNSQYAALKAKDSICDKLNSSKGRRPHIDKRNPDMNLKLVIESEKCIIYANSSGKPLYIRGYKKTPHQAPINESLASGLIYLSEWDKKQDFLDPMCGSGTICMEASMIKRNIPPGVSRRFSFQNWLNYDYDLYLSIFENLIRGIDEESKNNIFGSDIDSESINACKITSQSFRFDLAISFTIKNITSFKKEKQYHIVVNPPYQIRIGDESDIKSINKGLKNLLKFNSQVYLIYPKENNFIKDNYKFKEIALIYNGPIECGFYKIENV